MEPNFSQKKLTLAMEIGQRMLSCGAEIGRVKDSIRRIARAYGAVRIDVFTITSSIVVTAFDTAGEVYTQTRCIGGQSFDLSKLSALNALSRHICRHTPEDAQVMRAIARIDVLPSRTFIQNIALYGLVSGAFAAFFGAGVVDTLCAAVLGALLCVLQAGLLRLEVHGLLSVLLCSVAGGLGAHALEAVGIADSAAALSIGNVMLFIPGIAFTNGIRDLFSGDTISALLRIAEALVASIAIACGFAIPVMLF